MSEELLPREKALTYGIFSLTNVELIALILKSGYKDKSVFKLASELLDICGGFRNLLSLSYDELVGVKGIKKSKALEILAILEISKRLCKVDNVSDVKGLNPLMLVDYLRFNQGFKNQEEFFVVYLNNAGKILKSSTLFKGTSSSSLVGVDEILRQGLLLKANSMVIAHNHPSDNVSPSNEDIQITKQIKQAGDLVQIKLLDHIIISKSSYYSFKEAKLLW